MRDPLYWVFYFNGCVPVLKELKARAHVYYSMDELAGIDRCEEQEVARSALCVFAASPGLVEKYQALNSLTHLLPTGLEYERFEKERLSPTPRPDDLPGDARVIGYIGIVNHRLDFRRLLDVARAYPAAYLVLVGPIQYNRAAVDAVQDEAWRALRGLPNVRILGFKPTSDLARYIRAFDVCILPFLPTPFNWYSDPMKLYLYLGMGKPVVTRVNTAMESFKHLLYSADTGEEFVEQVGHALAEPPDPGVLESRLALARSRNWPRLVDVACEWINQANAKESVERDLQ